MGVKDLVFEEGFGEIDWVLGGRFDFYGLFYSRGLLRSEMPPLVIDPVVLVDFTLAYFIFL